MTAGALAADKITATAETLVNSVATQAKVAGISVNSANLKAAAVSALENLAGMSSKIDAATSVDAIASGQKTALTQKTFTLQLLHFSDGEAGTLAPTTAPDSQPWSTNSRMRTPTALRWWVVTTSFPGPSLLREPTPP